MLLDLILFELQKEMVFERPMDYYNHVLNINCIEHMNEWVSVEKAIISYSDYPIHLIHSYLGKLVIKSKKYKDTLRSIYWSLPDYFRKTALIKNTKKLYSAAHPQRIAELLDSRKKQFDELLPVLLARSGSYGNKPKIQMLEGLSGVKHAYQEAYKLLSEGKHNEGLWFGNISFLLDNFPEFISEYDKI